jgi:S-adenosylhomocysteine hydrolase
MSKLQGSRKMIKDFMNCVVTDGIHAFREKHQCYWIFSDVIPVAMLKFKGKEGFLNCTLTVKDHKAKMVIDDGNDNILYTQDYKWTDLDQGISFYAVENEIGTYTIMLKEEY